MSALYQALLAVQRDMPTIPKDSVNPFHKSKYASLDTVLSIVRPVLTKHGLVLSQSVTTPDRNDAGAVTAFTIVTRLIHAETGETLESPVVMPLVKSDPQGAGGALTYGRRYGIQVALGITAEEDDDGNHASRPAKVPAKPERVTRPLSAPAAPTAKPLLIKGKPLADADLADIRHAKQWYEENGGTQKYAAQIEQVDQELARRTDA